MKENEVRELMRKKSEKVHSNCGGRESKVEKQNTNPLLNLHDSNLKISKWEKRSLNIL